MAIAFACSGCGEILAAEAEFAGSQVRCSECGVVTVVPVKSKSKPPAEPDDFGEERPRRRSRTKNKRPMWVYVLLGLGAIFAITACTCGFVVTNFNNPRWDAAKPNTDGVTVDVPKRLKRTEEVKREPGLGGLTTVRSTKWTRTVLNQPIEVFELASSEIPAEMPEESIGPFLDLIGNAMVQSGKMRVISKDKGTMGGQPSRIWALETNGGKGIIQMTTKGKKIYLLMAAGPDFEKNNPKVRHFFESFRFDDGQPPPPPPPEDDE